MLQQNAGFQHFPKALKQKIEADGGVSPSRRHPTTHSPSCSSHPTAWLGSLPHHAPHRLAHRLQGTTGLPAGFSSHLFFPGEGGPAMPTHSGRQVGQSSRTSQRIAPDLCSPVWGTGKRQQPAPHAAAMPAFPGEAPG